MTTTLGSAVAVGTALERLGQTADEVAATLKEHGHEGRRNDQLDCPIAHYLLKATDIPWHVAWHIARQHGDEHVFAVLPDPVDDFVAWFDRGKYPELIRDLDDVLLLLETDESYSEWLDGLTIDPPPGFYGSPEVKQ